MIGALRVNTAAPCCSSEFKGASFLSNRAFNLHAILGNSVGKNEQYGILSSFTNGAQKHTFLAHSHTFCQKSKKLSWNMRKVISNI